MRDIILIPTYNERANIEEIIKNIFDIVPAANIVVVDDSSPDGTAEIVRNLMPHYIHLSLIQRPGKEGLGLAYLDAFTKMLTQPDIRSLVMMDADFSHDPRYLPEMLRQIEKNDVVIGSRYTKDGGTEGWQWHRKMLSKFGNWYCRFITRMPIHDCTAGFNIIRTDILRKVDFVHLKKFRGYAFMMALKYELWRKGAHFFEVPIIFKDRMRGKSKMSQQIVREGIITPWRLWMGSAPFGGYGLMIGGVVVAGLVLRLGALMFGIPYDNVFGDEIAHVLAAFNLLEHRTIIANFPFYYLPPLMAYLTVPVIGVMGILGMMGGVFHGVAGFREFAILHREYFLMAPRLVSALLSTLAIPAIFFLGKSFKSARVGFFASILLAFDFLVMHESQIGHIWGPTVFVIIAASYWILQVHQQARTNDYIFSAVAISVGYGISQVPLILYPWFLLAHFMSTTHQKSSFFAKVRDKKLWIATGLVVAPVLLFTILNTTTFYKHVNDAIAGINTTLGAQVPTIVSSSFSPQRDISFSWRRNWSVIGTTLWNTNPFLLISAAIGCLMFLFSRKKSSLFEVILFIGFPVLYLFAASFVFYKLTIRYVLPASPFLVMLAAYFFDELFVGRRIMRYMGTLVLVIVLGYSLFLDGQYFYLLQKPYTVGEGIEWVERNIPDGSRIIADHFLNPDKASIAFLAAHNAASFDTRRQLLAHMNDSQYPHPNYFVVDTNAIDVKKLTSHERAVDYIFLSFYYDDELQEKRNVLPLFPKASLVYAVYPKRSAQPVKNLLNLDPNFAQELFSINQLGPNVEIYRTQ